MRRIYLDYNATTPADPSVIDAMLPFFDERFGNPGSAHALGREAAEAIARARSQVAALVVCAFEDVYFTGCATEANNLVLFGRAAASDWRGHIVVSAVEHPSVREPARVLANRGIDVTVLPVDETGLADPDDLARAIRPDTIVVSIMHANNETGTIQPVAELAAVCRERDIPFHSDCSQSAGKIPVDLSAWGADFATFAGHKVYVPKGIGVLARRTETPLVPMLHGGGQEHGLRGGTENVPFIAAIGRGFERAAELMPNEPDRWRRLRDRLHTALAEVGGVLNGHPERRLPNTLNISFPGLAGADILAKAPEVLAGTGAACHDRRVRLSPVLQAMGVSERVGMGAIRLTVGRGTTDDDVEAAAHALARSVKDLGGVQR